MDTGWLHHPGASADADDASSSAASCVSASRASRLRRGIKLRLRRRRQEPALPPRAGGGGSSGAGVQDDLALPLGMSFAAVLAQVMNTKNHSRERLQPALLSKICTSAVKESLRNIYGDKLDSFARNFEKSFSSTLGTLHLVNEMPVLEEHEQSSVRQCSSTHLEHVAASKRSTDGPQNPAQEISQDHFSSVESQLVLYAGENQQLNHHCRSPHRADLLSTFERSLKEQARSNELKEFEIGLSMRKLQLKQSQLELHSRSHMLEKIKLSFGFQKAAFQGEKFKTQMQDTRDAQILRTLIDFLVSAVIIMSVCFGYGTYIYSYQRITDFTEACSVASKGSRSWWMPNKVSNFSSGLLFIRCHLIAATRMCFGIIMILSIAWLAFQRSAVTGTSMPVTFNFILLGVICGFAGRLCTNTLGGNGNIWLIYWEVLCSIHLLGNCYPSVLYRILHGPISVSHSKEVVWLPYWIRRCMFYAMLGFIIPALTGLLPFASVSEWKNHFADQLKLIFIGENVEV